VIVQIARNKIVLILLGGVLSLFVLEFFVGHYLSISISDAISDA
jgi:hypothetical protein